MRSDDDEVFVVVLVALVGLVALVVSVVAVVVVVVVVVVVAMRLTSDLGGERIDSSVRLWGSVERGEANEAIAKWRRH